MDMLGRTVENRRPHHVFPFMMEKHLGWTPPTLGTAIVVLETTVAEILFMS
jgi:hypothetical protein